MRASYLIKLVEDFCKENNLDISKIYRKMADIYQSEWGINIDNKMKIDGFYDITYYLESLGIVERYITILNGLEKMIKNDYDLELDKL